MKIGILQYNFQNGGAQNIMVKTANLLALGGLEVIMFVIDNSGPLSKRLNENVTVLDIKSKTIRKSFLPLATQIKRQKPDFLITTLLGPSILLILCNLVLFLPSKVIIREASTPSLEPKKTIKVKLLYMFGRIVLQLAHKIIAVSEGVKEDLISFYKLKRSKISVIYNPVFSINDYRPVEKKFNCDKVNILFMGRITPVKRIELQLKAIALLIADKISIQFNIVGNIADHAYYLYLKSLIVELGIEKEVVWHNYVENVKSVYQNNDILLLTSQYEGLPSVLIEAMFYNLEIIACDCKHGPREILQNGQIGKLLDIKLCCPKYLADEIKSITLNFNKSINNSQYLEKFSMESVINKYLYLFNCSINDKNS